MCVVVCSEKGRVLSCGSNRYGCLGLVHPTPSALVTPTLVEPMKGVVKVACGRLHSAAIDGNGVNSVCEEYVYLSV